MKSKIFIVCVVILAILNASLVFSGCEPKKHNFDGSYSFDEYYHYRVCTDNGCAEKKDKAEHVFGEWIVIEEPSTNKQGVKERACNVCKYKKQEIVPIVEKLDREINLKSGVTLDKVYDGNAVAVSVNDFEYDGGGEGTIMFAADGSDEWFAEAPKGIGKYTLKITVAETETHKEAEKTFGFEINTVLKLDREINLKSGVTLDKVYDGNAVAVSVNDFEYDGGGEGAITFAAEGSDEWFAEAPKDIGKYTLKITVAETETHKEAEKTFGFEIKKPVVVGDYKDFTVTDANGQKIKLSEFIGKPIVINFWASWCAPCRAELPHFDKLAKELKGQAEFLMVSVYLNKEQVKQFVSQNGYTFPLYFDYEEEGANAYEVTGIPVTVFITAEGNVKAKVVGAMSEAVLRSYINQIM